MKQCCKNCAFAIENDGRTMICDNVDVPVSVVYPRSRCVRFIGRESVLAQYVKPWYVRLRDRVRAVLHL